MRRVLAFVVGLAGLAAGIVALADATQNRPDVVVAGSTTTVEFTVSTRQFQRGEPAAAAALWTVCAATVGGEVSLVPEPLGDGWEVRIEPAIGEHGENRLVGCIEDATLDRVLGDVVRIHSVP